MPDSAASKCASLRTNAALAACGLLTWETCTMEAFRAARHRKWAEAAAHWSAALDLTATFQSHDPRRATAHHNAGVAQLIRQHDRSALENFAAAREYWRAARNWVEKLDVPLAGQGSIFHFQLAGRHGDAFADIRRRHYAALYNGGAAITSVLTQITTFWAHGASPGPTAFDSELSLLASAFGSTCPEFQFLRQIKARAFPFLPVSARTLFHRWYAQSAKAPSETRELMASTHLTAGLHPTHFPWADRYRVIS